RLNRGPMWSCRMNLRPSMMVAGRMTHNRTTRRNIETAHESSGLSACPGFSPLSHTMETRSIDDAIVLAAGPNQVFDLLITPSRVRSWWGASCAIIIPRLEGLWVAVVRQEDQPDYVSAHRITGFDPPRLLRSE